MIEWILLGCIIGLWIIINLFENRFEREIKRQNEMHEYLVDQVYTIHVAFRDILKIIVDKKE